MSAGGTAAPAAPRRDPLAAWEFALWRIAQDDPLPGEPGYGMPDGIGPEEAEALDLPA